MSVPKTLEIPAEVSIERFLTDRGQFAAHMARAHGERRGSILLIPGWTGSKEDFTPVLPLLADAGYDTVAFDQRGQYESTGLPGDDYSLPALARDAWSLADVAFGPDRGAVHVAGHSFGGLVAQHLALGDRARTRTLSLVCSGPGALGESPTRPLKRLIGAIGKVPLLDIHEVREAGIRRPAAISAFLARRFVANAPSALKAFTQHLLDAPDRIDEVAALGLPVWVARGATDDAWPHDVQAEMAARLGTDVVVLPSAAHSPAVEAPEEFTQAWLPFLGAH